MEPIVPDVVSRLGALHVAVVSDVLDALGCRDQTAAPGLLQLGTPDRVVGRAFTLSVEEVDVAPAELYATQLEAADQLTPGDLVVAATPASAPSAYWGELFTTRAMHQGCVGALVDGYVRDLAAIRSYGFPIWGRGTHPADSAGRLDTVGYQQPISWAGVHVRPGDVVLADPDGVVVVPAELAEQVARRAQEKLTAEDLVRTELRAGASVAEVYARHGVM